jgi:tripartite-type tricarboxylate transporter receptor subunit TctC
VSKKKLIALFGASVLSLGLAACGGSDDDSGGSSPAAAEEKTDFPTDDVRLIISYAAGGPTDVAGRAVAAYMEKEFGVSVVAENIEGGSGGIGTAEMARSKPDGYTIAMTTGSAVGRVPLIEDVGYQLEDVQPLGVATFGPGLIMVRSDSKYKTIDDLVKAAKKDPGKITVATAGPQSPQHVELVRMARDYKVEFQPVPFQGEAPAVTALLGSNVEACFCSNAQTTMAQVDSGEFRLLATGAPDRLASQPDLPTLAESGFEDLIYGNSYFILAAPAGTPKPVVAKLEKALQGALEDPATVKVIGEERLLDEFMGADDLTSMLQDEQDVLKPIIKELFGS